VNSVVANNPRGGNCGLIYNANLTSNGYNLSSDDSCNFNNTGDLNDTDPKLGPLHNNGGATQTEALLPGSPAIDAGNSTGCTDGKGHLLGNDQRGYHRPGDPKLTAGCDMGAYEVRLGLKAHSKAGSRIVLAAVFTLSSYLCGISAEYLQLPKLFRF
jgi:hypothetical protein